MTLTLLKLDSFDPEFNLVILVTRFLVIVDDGDCKLKLPVPCMGHEAYPLVTLISLRKISKNFVVQKYKGPLFFVSMFL